MKRTAVVFLIFALLISGMAVNAFDNQEAGIDIDKEYTILSALNIIDVREDFSPVGKVSKSEFLAMLIRMSGVAESNLSGVKQIFYDVPESHKYNAYVKYGFETGIVSGTGDGFLGAEDELSLNEAAAMTVRALRYDIAAQADGGYVTGYISTAHSLGLLDGVKADQNGRLNMGGACKLVYNALKTDLMQVLKMTDGTHSYETQRNQTLFSSVFHVFRVSGLVQANRFAALPAGAGTGKDTVIIGEETYFTGDTEAEHYLGYSVEAYYLEEDEDKTLIYVDTRRTKTELLDTTEIISCTNGAINYVDTADREKTYKISPTASVYMNYEIVTFDSEFKIPDVAIFELVDSNRDSVYDVVKITAYETLLAARSDASGGIIYVKNNTSENILLTEFETVRIRDLAGNSMEVSDIAADQLLQVARCRDVLADIIVIPNTMEVYIETIADSSVCNRETAVKVRGAEAMYIVAPSAEQMIHQPKLELGKSYRAALNIFGEIAAVLEVSDSKISYGYLIDSALIEGLDIKVKFKMFTAEGEICELDAAEKLTTNLTEGNIKAADFVKNYVKGSSVVRYVLNAEDKVSKLELPDEHLGLFDEGFRKIGEAGESYNGRYKRSSKTIGGQILVDDKTIVFGIPKDVTQTDEFFVGASGTLQEDAYYTSAIGYSGRNYTMAADVVVLDAASSAIVNESSPIMVVKDIGMAYSQQEEECVMLEGYVSGKLQTIMLKSSTAPVYSFGGKEYEIQSGDVVKYALDRNGMVENLETVYSRTVNQILFGAKNTSGFSVNDRNDIGTPAKKLGNALKIIPEGRSEISSDIYVMSPTDSYVYEYDMEKRTLKLISAEDIMTIADDSTAIESKMYINLFYSLPRVIVVYK